MKKEHLGIIGFLSLLCLSSCFVISCSESNETCEHHFVTEKGIAATCVVDGLSDKIYCDKCNYVSQEHEIIKALGHNVVKVAEKLPGIQYEGHNAYSYCDRCGLKLSEEEIIPNLLVKNEIYSHTYDDGKIDFTLMIHKQDVPYHVEAKVEYLDQIETFNFDNINTFSYDHMENDVRYVFSFDIKYEDDDYENLTQVSRYIKTTESKLPFLKIETKDYEWPSFRKVSAPPGCWGLTQTDNNYVNCLVDLYDASGNQLYHSATSEDDKYANAKMKSRGNTTSYVEKSPYKIKLGEKVDLLKDFLPNRSVKTYKDKEWLLLVDDQYLKTPVGFYVNSYLSNENSLNGTYLDLYVNGDYRGVYFLSESVKRGGGNGDKQCRVPINEDGYIIEDDAYWWNEDVNFPTSLINVPTKYTFKYPDSDDVVQNQIDYIQNYMNQFEDKLVNDIDSISDYIDLNSFATWLLTHDLLGSEDSGGSNIFLTKKDSLDSLIKMGPTWDYDSILKTPSNQYYRIRYENHFYYNRLVNYQPFTTEYNSMFLAKKDVLITSLIDYVSNTINLEDLASNILIDNDRWSVTADTPSERLDDIVTYLEEKIEFIQSNI